MKYLNKNLLMLLTGILILVIASSCGEDEVTGEPSISYIRVTNPDQSDSLLVAGYLGDVIVIVGKNLGSIKEVWFNDQEATIVPTFVTNTSVLVNIPSGAPAVVTNEIRALFGGGKEITTPFTIEIPGPEIEYMLNEWEPVGGTTEIHGEYFFDPIQVMFPGNVEAEVNVVSSTVIEVTVPEGATMGPVTVSTNFGEEASPFYYADNRNLIWHSDPVTGWWGADRMIDASDPDAINGNYVRMTGTIGEWQWVDWIGGPADAIGDQAVAIPDQAIQRPDLYYLKFETKTDLPFNANRINILFGTIDGVDFASQIYEFLPTLDTDGKWQTIFIPFDEVIDSMPGMQSVNPSGYGFRFWMWGPGGTLELDMSFDNFRVVPRES